MNKKLLELVVLIICSTSFCLGETVEFVQNQKDAPSFFDSLDKNQDSGFVRDVRVPRGFYGMRGKKDLGVNEVEKRALLGIPMSRERIIDRNRLQESNINSFVPKRAQFPGFFGIRGNQQPTDYDNEIVGDKRAPSGFMGMRGKKSYDEDYLNMDSAYPNSQSNEGYFNNYDKRAPRGFFAMRGKKSLESLEPQNL